MGIYNIASSCRTVSSRQSDSLLPPKIFHRDSLLRPTYLHISRSIMPKTRSRKCTGVRRPESTPYRRAVAGRKTLGKRSLSTAATSLSVSAEAGGSAAPLDMGQPAITAVGMTQASEERQEP